MGRARAAATWTAIAVVAAGAGFWAGRATFVPPAPEAESSAPALVTVADGSIGSVLKLAATVSWPLQAALTSPADGVVTSVVVPDDAPVDQGDVILSVGLAPVVVAEGSVPSFRDLAAGSKGADVAQLQRLLVDAGHLDVAPDGTYGPSTVAAVRRWQKAVGAEVTGAVAAGSVVFVPELPARLTLASGIGVGRAIARGADLVLPVAAVPDVTIRLDAERRAQAPSTGQVVRVDIDGTTVEGVVGDSTVAAETGVTTWSVHAPDGSPLCEKLCPDLAYAGGQLTYPATVVTAPEVAGAVVPLAALATAADGSSFVVAPDGARVAVEIEAQDGAQAVVSGVEVGARIRLFADEGGTSDAGADPTSAAQP